MSRKALSRHCKKNKSKTPVDKSPLFLTGQLILIGLLIYYYVEVFFLGADAFLPTPPEVFFLPPARPKLPLVDKSISLFLELTDFRIGDTGIFSFYSNLPI